MTEQLFKTLQYVTACFIMFEAIVIFIVADIYLIYVIIDNVKDWLWFKKWHKKG